MAILTGFVVNSHRCINFVKGFLIAATLFLTISCGKQHKKPQEKSVKIIENIKEEVGKIIKDQIMQFESDSLLIIDDDTLVTADWIAKFFSGKNFSPIWSDQDKFIPASDSLLVIASGIEYFGLNSERYSTNMIIDKMNHVVGPDSDISVTRIYEVNILLTDLFFRMALHIKSGILNEKTLIPEWKGKHDDTTYITLLNSALKLNSFRSILQSLEPRFKKYKELKNYLGILIMQNEQYEEIEIAKTKRSYFEALNQYTDDAEILNIPYKNLTDYDSLQSHFLILKEKININMERWRWESPMEADYYLWINIPSNILEFYFCDEVILKSRIITGKPSTPTPYRLNSTIHYFFVYPYWIIPFSISTEEILPILKGGSHYLEDHNIEVLNRSGKIISPDSINWKKYSKSFFPFTLRQRDGDENTLGVLKFIFPNKYGIYLHDTNSPSLFKKEARALSHGCIRLEKARELAGILSDCCALNFTSDSLTKYVSKKTRKRVDLYHPLPIYIRYFTIDTDSGGLNSYNDVYSIDSIMSVSDFKK